MELELELELPPGTVIDGRYRVVGLLGEGAMCRVYLAEQLGLKRTVALKIPTAALLGTNTGLKRFLREARAAARLVHPNVVEIFEVGESSSPPYIAMEFVEGGDLGDGFDEGWDLGRSLPVLAGVARALGAARAGGVVHRDLKPENILVTVGGLAKVADWGLALLTDASTRLTATGFTVGTMVYMAPEQFTSGEVGPAADWYALGLVVYEAILVGHGVPRRERLAHLAGHLHGDLISVDGVVPDLAPGLAHLVGRLLAREVEDRLTDSVEVTRCLETAAAAPMVTRRDVGARGGARRSRREAPEAGASRGRSRGLPTVVLLLATLVALVAGVVVWRAWSGAGAEAGTGRVTGALVVREARLVAPSRLELRIEGGGPGDVVSVAVGALDGSTAPAVVAPLSAAREVSLRVRALDVDLPGPVFDEARVMVRDAGGGIAGTMTVSGRSFLDAVLAPVRRLQGERLARLLQALAELRDQLPGGRPSPALRDRADETLGGLLAGAGLTPAWREEARRILPRVVSAWAPVRLLDEVMPLRMIEALAVALPGCEAPWPSLTSLVGQAVGPEGGGNGIPGAQVLVDLDVMPRVPRPSNPAIRVPIPRWLLETAELERTLALRRFSIDSNVLSDQFSLAWSMAASETVVEFALDQSRVPQPPGRVLLQLGLSNFYREGYLELDLNGRGAATSLNASPQDGQVVRFQTLVLPVEPAWLVPGVNRLHLTARCLPGLRPLGPVGLRYVRLLAAAP